MQISILVVILLMLFFPGILWNYIYNSYTSYKNKSENSFIIKSLFLGIIVYIIEYVLFRCFYSKNIFYVPDLSDKNISNGINKILTEHVINEIICSIPISFVCAVANLYMKRFRLLGNFLQKINATKKFGSEDIWEYVLESDEKSFSWVRIVDFEKNISITGYISSFSESERLREILLSDVKFYTLEGDELYSCENYYISKPSDSISIEFLE